MNQWDGFYHGATCKNCGKPMGGNRDQIGYDRPAELYAGTYTGLCNACTMAGDFIVMTYALDGAVRISTKPHCPSWRRDREYYTAYNDCPDCKGKGYKQVSRAFAAGGPYNSYCETCFNRFYNHPLRKACQVYSHARYNRLRDTAIAMWNDQLRKYFKLSKKAFKNWKPTDEQAAEIDVLRQQAHEPGGLIFRYNTARDRLNQYRKNKFSGMAEEL